MQQIVFIRKQFSTINIIFPKCGVYLIINKFQLKTVKAHFFTIIIQNKIQVIILNRLLDRIKNKEVSRTQPTHNMGCWVTHETKKLFFF